jgi:pSer/pThr/pTyr-binding forkhead associated (FHA) protein
MHRIKITNCKNHIEEITLPEGAHTIGRTLESTLRLEGEEVSRTHARLLVRSTQCEIVDENSRNGTFINGKKIKAHYLCNGDIIQVGKFNLQFISDTSKPHLSIASGLEAKKHSQKSKFIIFILIAFLIFISGLTYYYKTAGQEDTAKLAEITAQYIAEKIKEDLYLGEYDLLDLSNIPQNVGRIAIWDRNGILRVYKPLDNNPPKTPFQINTMQTYKKNDSVEIYTPIYYKSTSVGVLWVEYIY